MGVGDAAWSGLRAGHWLLIGLVVMLVSGVAYVVVRGDGDPSDSTAAPTSPSTALATPSSVCRPKATDIGYTTTKYGGQNAALDFGLIVTNTCSQATVNNFVTVTAIGTDGKPLPTSQASTLLQVPVLLPGQHVAVGGTVLVESPASTLQTTLEQTQNVPASTFTAWPTSTRFTDITHTGPDAAGNTDVRATLISEPAAVTLCNPKFFLVLRNAAHQIIFGTASTANGPTFRGRLPAGADWQTAEISVVLGRSGLGGASIDRLTCRSQ